MHDWLNISVFFDARLAKYNLCSGIDFLWKLADHDNYIKTAPFRLIRNGAVNFGIIRFSKKDFYACDTIDCKGKKKKIGEIHSSSISESTLHCALKLGGGCGLINASKSDSYSLLEYLKQKSK